MLGLNKGQTISGTQLGVRKGKGVREKWKKKEEEEEGRRGKRPKPLDSGLFEKKGQYSSLSPISYFGTSGTLAIKSGSCFMLAMIPQPHLPFPLQRSPSCTSELLSPLFSPSVKLAF